MNEQNILWGPTEKPRYGRTVVIAGVVIGEFYCMS